MIDLLIGLFLASLIVGLFSSRLYQLIFWYSANSLILGLLALWTGKLLDDKAMLVTGILTILMKAVSIPYLLKYLANKYHFARQLKSEIKLHYTIILVPVILVFTFYLAEPLSLKIGNNANYVAISISSLFLSLFMMMQHKGIAAKIIGFLSLENALFLLGVTATDGMPMLVELGIFFDLLMAIVVINLLFRKEDSER